MPVNKLNKFSKKIVSLVVFLNTGFSAVVLYVFLRTGSEPSTLVTAWFAFTTGELWMLSTITKTKHKTKVKKEGDGTGI